MTEIEHRKYILCNFSKIIPWSEQSICCRYFFILFWKSM